MNFWSAMCISVRAIYHYLSFIHSEYFSFFVVFAITTSGFTGPLPRLGAMDFSSTSSPAEKETLKAVMFRLRERANQRRVLAKPCFQDFDK